MRIIFSYSIWSLSVTEEISTQFIVKIILNSRFKVSENCLDMTVIPIAFTYYSIFYYLFFT